MNKSVLEKLKALDAQAVPFYEANKLLLGEGYSEAEILDALYQFNYDGKPDKPKETNKTRDYYEKHPEAAQEMAGSLLRTKAQDEKYLRINEAASNLAASKWAPGHHARAYYGQKFAGSVGVPFFSTLLVIVITFALIFQFDLPIYLAYVAPFAYIVLFLFIDRLRH